VGLFDVVCSIEKLTVVVWVMNETVLATLREIDQIDVAQLESVAVGDIGGVGDGDV